MHVVIIGGGFAGAACALHLLRDHPGLECALTIVEPRETLGAGLAYSSPAAEHRTNVAAARMSVLPDVPSHFHDWLLAEDDPVRDPASAMPDGRLYPARRVFGRYVSEQLQAQLAGRLGIVFRHVRQVAQSVEADGAGLRVTLDDGTALNADAVVLAVSHSAPDLPPPLCGSHAVLADPWDVAALDRIPATARVLIVGTGLTASDVAARHHHALPPRPAAPPAHAPAGASRG